MKPLSLPPALSRRQALTLAAAAPLLSPFICTARAQAASRQVTVGVLGDYAGGKDLGGPGSLTGAKLAAADAMPAMPGWTIDLIGADHHNKPDVASALARSWFDNEDVDAITGLAISSVGSAVARLAAEKDRSVLIPSSSGASAPLPGPTVNAAGRPRLPPTGSNKLCSG